MPFQLIAFLGIVIVLIIVPRETFQGLLKYIYSLIYPILPYTKQYAQNRVCERLQQKRNAKLRTRRLFVAAKKCPLPRNALVTADKEQPTVEGFYMKV